MGREAEDVLFSLKLSDTKKLDYDTVTRACTKHFMLGMNIINKRANFNSRKQEAQETVNTFITKLFRLAETCEYGDLKEELIRDRLVVGLIDKQLSEKLQLHATTLLCGPSNLAPKYQFALCRQSAGKNKERWRAP